MIIKITFGHLSLQARMCCPIRTEGTSKATCKSPYYQPALTVFAAILRSTNFQVTANPPPSSNKVQESPFYRSGEMDVYINNEIRWKEQTAFHPCH
jgi:hypothetical protein